MELRKHIMLLDSGIKEVFRMQYIAYTVKRSFVEIVPQKNSLVLSLRMDAESIHDPKALCRDVHAIGRWTNGNIEYRVCSLQDIEYAMELVQQAYKYILQ